MDLFPNRILMHFSLSKKKIKTVIPGFINYCYAETAGPTKSTFTNYKLFTIHGIITLNTLIYINKIRNHSLALALS